MLSRVPVRQIAQLVVVKPVKEEGLGKEGGAKVKATAKEMNGENPSTCTRTT